MSSKEPRSIFEHAMRNADPSYVPSGLFEKVDNLLPKLSDMELGGLVGAVVAELVNRGNDHETALDLVYGAAQSGAEASRLFDQMEL